MCKCATLYMFMLMCVHACMCADGQYLCICIVCMNAYMCVPLCTLCMSIAACEYVCLSMPVSLSTHVCLYMCIYVCAYITERNGSVFIRFWGFSNTGEAWWMLGWGGEKINSHWRFLLETIQRAEHGALIASSLLAHFLSFLLCCLFVMRGKKM